MAQKVATMVCGPEQKAEVLTALINAGFKVNYSVSNVDKVIVINKVATGIITAYTHTNFVGVPATQFVTPEEMISKAKLGVLAGGIHNEVIMSISEIESKLGISNLKIKKD